mmetsp:Transcript_26316/g.81281  ORF Transcript_26316/g.81281 Transcript_26316/m.81281 type:complete len:212 (-) Transcript_26316:539-1174(-)
MCVTMPGSTPTTGPSSMIFWWRRCTEQSRVRTAMQSPYESASSCTSRWRTLVSMRMTKMWQPLTSSLTASNIGMTSAMSYTLRMPLPPPPSDALSITGKPTRFTTSTHSSAVSTKAWRYTSSSMLSVPRGTRSESPDHGTVGTSSDCAMMLEAILSPRANMAFSCGPRKRTFFVSTHMRGSFGFSDAWPQPGYTASQFWRSAVSTMRSTLA